MRSRETTSSLLRVRISGRRLGRELDVRRVGALLKSGGETPPTPHATLSVDKETFCGDSPTDAHNLLGGVVLSGTQIFWTYDVTAIQDAVSGLILTDDNGTPGDTTDDFQPTAVLGADGIHNIGDVNNDGVLGLGETWQFKQTGTATVGSYSNTATADGISVQDNTAAGEGFGTSGYFGADPHIHITKVTTELPTRHSSRARRSCGLTP